MGLFSTAINANLTKAQMAQQERLQREQWAREDTAITRQVADARRNGINPLTALGQQGFGSTTDISGAMVPFDSMKDSINQSASDRSQRWIAKESNKVALAKMKTDKEIADANLEQMRIQNEWLRGETSFHNRNVENETATHNRNVEKETAEHNDVEERIGLDNRDPLHRVENGYIDLKTNQPNPMIKEPKLTSPSKVEKSNADLVSENDGTHATKIREHGMHFFVLKHHDGTYSFSYTDQKGNAQTVKGLKTSEDVIKKARKIADKRKS